jgi:GTP-binding protein HflX
MRAVTLPSRRKIIISDTVGFISDLPTQLVAAFRATLEEVLEANVLLHVRDISHPDTDAQKKDVGAVLGELGVAIEAQDAMIEVWNKIDLLPADLREQAETASNARHHVAVSALTGEGVDDLLKAIDAALADSSIQAELRLDSAEGADLAWAYANGDVLSRNDREDGLIALRVSLPVQSLGKFERRYGPRMVRA